MPFGVDAGFGDALTVEPDVLVGSSFLDFVGVEPSKLRLYPRETHVAEKLHAYTLPRRHENSRVKDLPDIALLASTGPFDAGSLRNAMDETFSFRRAHDVPMSLPTPPSSWQSVYARRGRNDALPWQDLRRVTAAARAFLDPLVAESTGTCSQSM